MKKSMKMRFVEWAFSLLQPFEKTIIAQKILAENGRDPKVQESFENAFGVNTKQRSVKQWQNLVRVYGADTVARIEGMSEAEVRLQCKKQSEQLKEKWRLKRV